MNTHCAFVYIYNTTHLLRLRVSIRHVYVRLVSWCLYTTQPSCVVHPQEGAMCIYSFTVHTSRLCLDDVPYIYVYVRLMKTQMRHIIKTRMTCRIYIRRVSFVSSYIYTILWRHHDGLMTMCWWCVVHILCICRISFVFIRRIHLNTYHVYIYIHDVYIYKRGMRCCDNVSYIYTVYIHDTPDTILAMNMLTHNHADMTTRHTRIMTWRFSSCRHNHEDMTILVTKMSKRRFTSDVLIMRIDSHRNFRNENHSFGIRSGRNIPNADHRFS